MTAHALWLSHSSCITLVTQDGFVGAQLASPLIPSSVERFMSIGAGFGNRDDPSSFMSRGKRGSSLVREAFKAIM